MNIPVGSLVVGKLSSKSIDAKKMLQDLINKSFNGYISITTLEENGFEDGMIVFEDGIIKGASHNFLFKNKSKFGQDALSFILNIFASNYGTIDIFKLTKEQVELILTFNEQIKTQTIKNLSNINNLFKTKYDSSLLGIKQNDEKSKYDLFKQIGLGNVKI